MDRNLYKLTKLFDEVIVILMLGRHQTATAKKVEGFRNFFAEYLKNGFN